jgi:hypothetical protein
MPAVNRTLSNNVDVKIWYKNNKIHRNNGPALIATNNYINLEVWYKNNKIHRIGDPAVSINVSATAPTSIYPPELAKLFDDLTMYNTDLAPRTVLKHLYDMVYTGKLCSNVCYEDGVQISNTPRKSWAAHYAYDADEDEKLIAGLLSEIPKPKIYNACEEVPIRHSYFQTIIEAKMSDYYKPCNGTRHMNDWYSYKEGVMMNAKYLLENIDKDYYDNLAKNMNKFANPTIPKV